MWFVCNKFVCNELNKFFFFVSSSFFFVLWESSFFLDSTAEEISAEKGKKCLLEICLLMKEKRRQWKCFLVENANQRIRWKSKGGEGANLRVLASKRGNNSNWILPNISKLCIEGEKSVRVLHFKVLPTIVSLVCSSISKSVGTGVHSTTSPVVCTSVTSSPQKKKRYHMR